MNAKLAALIAARSLAIEVTDDVTRRYLVKTVYPDISRQAHNGLTQAWVNGPMSDLVVAALRSQGYVVRRERYQQTTIEWCPQVVMGDDGKPTRVSPDAYNREWAKYDEAKSQIAVY